jgi:hypothetical protein
MKYTIEELGFILYNNRSVNGVVKNFLPTDINPFQIIKIEKILDKVKENFSSDNRMVEVNIKELNSTADDVIVTPKDLENLTSLIIENIGNFSQDEFEYLISRGIGEQTILEYKLLGLSSIIDLEHLRMIGATSHPVLKQFLDDGIENGGIIIPLFENDKLVNCAIRKLNIGKDNLTEKFDPPRTKTLKYSLACPDVPVWGLNDIEEKEEIWVTEGIFDMMALRRLGRKSVSCSSAMWSAIQLYRILERKPNSIVIVSDNDNVGLRVSATLRDFFEDYKINTKVVVSKIGKDPAEHYFQKHKGLEDFIDIEITNDMIELKVDDSFNFINYLKNRNF